MQDMTMIWNAILTMAVGGFLWWIRTTSASITKIRNSDAYCKRLHEYNLLTVNRLALNVLPSEYIN